MAETDNSLPCASLYTDFSGSKKSPKDFRRSNAAAKANYTYVWLFLPICGGNGLSTSMCNPILTLFYGEKSSCEDELSKSRSRDYSPLDNPPTGGFCPNLNFFALIIFTSVTALLLRYVRVTYGKIAARLARGYGVLHEVPVLSAQVLFFI